MRIGLDVEEEGDGGLKSNFGVLGLCNWMVVFLADKGHREDVFLSLSLIDGFNKIDISGFQISHFVMFFPRLPFVSFILIFHRRRV